ncbi:hypothetical protein DL769_008583 [Monosporascus sp. CRB-8-3]|nr:hypothetical protein DL769_008583 [Monosporascus sp. CRB-8-3]
MVHIPESRSTVDVRVIDTNTLVFLKPELFWQPEIEGFTGLHAPIYCFLISNGSRHVVFDLGVRPDWQNYAPRIVSLVKATTVVTPGSDVSSVLDSDQSGVNIRSADIEAVIWSHNHFDHIGDVSTFPSTTDLVVGPGVRALSWPGWPRQPDAIVRDSDAEDRVMLRGTPWAIYVPSPGPRLATIRLSFSWEPTLAITREYFGPATTYRCQQTPTYSTHWQSVANVPLHSSSDI